MNSLKLRLLIGSSTLLVLCLLLTGFALNGVLNEYSKQAEYDRLQSIVYMLLAGLDISSSDTVLIGDSQIREIRLLQPESGLTAVVTKTGLPIWESNSTPQPYSLVHPTPLTDEWRYSKNKFQSTTALSYGFEWVNLDNNVVLYAIEVTDSNSPLLLQQQKFAQTLWQWLIGIGIIMMLLMLALMHWTLQPLKKISSELSQIKKGKAERLSENFPTEIKPLTQSMNRFIEHEHKQISRFRNSLADLAHSLKTPLAVIKTDPTIKDSPHAIEQVDQIDQIIRHQLSKAAASGRRLMAAPVPVHPIAGKVISALEKVYADHEIKYQNQIEPNFNLSVSDDDLTEIMGILMDNASKYGAKTVELYNQNSNTLVIQDDGPGISALDFARLIERGTRGDTLQSGTGIGLAIALEIIKANSGQLKHCQNYSNGLKLEIQFSE